MGLKLKINTERSFCLCNFIISGADSCHLQRMNEPLYLHDQINLYEAEHTLNHNQERSFVVSKKLPIIVNCDKSLNNPSPLICEEALKSIGRLSVRRLSDTSKPTGRSRSRSVRESVKSVELERCVDPSTITCKITLKEMIHREYIRFTQVEMCGDLIDETILNLNNFDKEACSILQIKRDWKTYRYDFKLVAY